MPITPDSLQYLHKHIPPTPQRNALMHMLQESMMTANRVAPARWTLTCNKQVVRLNVGMIEVLVVTASEINIVVDYATMSAGAAPALSVDYEYIFPDHPGDGAYKSVPGSAAIFVAPADAITVMPQLRPAHTALMRNAARTQLNPAVAKAHQAELAQQIMARTW